MAICNEANEHSQHVEPETVEDSETEQEQEQEPESQHNLEVQSAPKPRPRMNDEQKRALQIHNQARRDASNITKHPRPGLVWDNKLANDAQAYAQHLANQNRGLQHSSADSRKGEGENLAWSKPHGSFHDASQMWVNEKKDYHGQKVGEGNFGAYGHYTQCIWPTTTRMGMGMAKARDGGVFVVGRYSPPGNWTGKTAYTG